MPYYNAGLKTHFGIDVNTHNVAHAAAWDYLYQGFMVASECV